MQEGSGVDTGDALDKVDQSLLRSNGDPVLREKYDVDRRDELLESPSTGKPSALAEGGALSLMVILARNIGEVRVTYCCETVPSVHRVDGLGKLRAARFVDAA